MRLITSTIPKMKADIPIDQDKGEVIERVLGSLGLNVKIPNPSTTQATQTKIISAKVFGFNFSSPSNQESTGFNPSPVTGQGENPPENGQHLLAVAEKSIAQAMKEVADAILDVSVKLELEAKKEKEKEKPE